MHRISGIVSGCGLLLATSGCSLLTKWPDVNDNTKAGAGGEDAGGSSSKAGNASKGGASNVGGASNLGGTSNLGGSSNGGASNVGGASNSSGQSNLGGSANGGTSSSAGTASNLGGSGNELGGASGLGGASNGGATSVGGGATGGNAGTGATTTLAIATSTLPTAKTGVAYNATVTASGASSYSWSIASGTLPSGVALQSTSSATLTIAGTPKEAGLFPLKLSVTDGTATKTIDLSLAVTHRVAFLSDRITSGVKELFLTEVGTETAASPVRLSAPIPDGNVSRFDWSRDGSHVAYISDRSNRARELMVASVSNPGAASTISLQVVDYVWLSGGQRIAYHTDSGNTYVVDVSTPAPWSSRLVPLPAIKSSDYRSNYHLAASPRPGEFILSYMDRPLGSTSGAPVNSRLVSWTSGDSFSIVSLRDGVQSGPPSLAFNGDGTLVSSAGADGGLIAHDIAALPTPKHYPLDTQVTHHTWSSRANRMLAQKRTLLAGLSLYSFSDSGVDSVLLTDPTCFVEPGPWSPDGSHVIFTCSNDLRAFGNVSAKSTNSDFTLLPSGFLLNAFTGVAAFNWSSDSKWVAFLADKDVDSRFDLYLTRWGSPGVVHKPYASSVGSGVTTWQFAPGSAQVAFVGAIGASTSTGVYLSTLPETGAPTSATPLTSASSPSVQNDITWLPGSRVVLYRANDVGGPQLHAVHVTPSGNSSTSLTVSGAGGTGVPSYAQAPMP